MVKASVKPDKLPEKNEENLHTFEKTILQRKYTELCETLNGEYEKRRKTDLKNNLKNILRRHLLYLST